MSGPRTIRAAAIDQHRDNFKLRDLAPEIAFREEAAPHDPELHSGACSPYWYMLEARGKVAIHSVSGWYDGSAFPNGSVARFLTMAGPHDRLLLGPWDHGARTNGSPWRDKPAPEFSVMAEVLRFFDEHLMGLDTGLRDEAPIHYLTLHEEKWKAASAWPPVSETTRLHLSAGGSLDAAASKEASTVAYDVRFGVSTGRASRYERLGAFAVLDYYADWDQRQSSMVSFTSAPFESATEMTGHAVVSLRVSTSERDGSVFVYLAEVDADGRARYVTEGGLRMLHRQLSPAPDSYKATWPWRTFHRKDAKLMQPGVAEELRFALVPVSWQFAKGSRLRVSIAGADADHFAQVPHGRPPRFEIVVGGRDGSFIDLPMNRKPGTQSSLAG